jgi:hypothetical protein
MTLVSRYLGDPEGRRDLVARVRVRHCFESRAPVSSWRLSAHSSAMHG